MLYFFTSCLLFKRLHRILADTHLFIGSINQSVGSAAYLVAVLTSLITGHNFGMNSLDKISAIVAMDLIIMAGYEIFSANLRSLLNGHEVLRRHDGDAP
jgi:divalent metal cation (Fe/Co/Zn/Cd) transporter